MTLLEDYIDEAATTKRLEIEKQMTTYNKGLEINERLKTKSRIYIRHIEELDEKLKAKMRQTGVGIDLLTKLKWSCGKIEWILHLDGTKGLLYVNGIDATFRADLDTLNESDLVSFLIHNLLPKFFELDQPQPVTNPSFMSKFCNFFN
jgi:hypothetical protein